MDGDRISKRYYWLKLNENFFEREEIKIIEDMPNGKDYIIFYMKLLLKSVGTEGVLKFRGIIPYTPEMLSSITNTDIDTVRVATDMFTKLELMEKWDDGTLFMAETQNMIGSETGWAKKKRQQREKEIEKGDIVPELSTNCPTEIELDKETETETETETDIDSISKYYLKTLQKIENYPFNIDKDMKYLETLKERYPQLDIVQAINKFYDYILDNPFKGNANHRSQLNTSFNMYNGWPNMKKKVDISKIIEENPYSVGGNTIGS